MDKLQLEKVIEKLKSREVKEWSCRGNLNDPEWWPYLSIKLGGLAFQLSKNVRGNAIRRVSDYFLSVAIEHFVIDSQGESSDKAGEDIPIGCLYNYVYDGFKSLRQEEFIGRINSFLAKDDPQPSMPQFKEVVDKLSGLEHSMWGKNSYLDIGTNFTTQSHGLIFTVGTGLDHKLVKDRKYHYLNVCNYEDDFLMNYKNPDPKSVEEKELCRLYNNLDRTLHARYNHELKEKLDALTSD